MKRLGVYLLILCLFAFMSSSCSRKTGCPAQDSTQVRLDKNGVPKKKPSSGLFDKRARRKMRN